MRILQVVQKPQRRGAEVFAFQLSAELRLQGHHVRTIYIYSHRDAKALPLHAEDQVLNGQETHWLEKVPGAHPALLKQLIRQIQAFQPDIVQVNGARTIKYGSFAKKLIPKQDWRLVYRNIDNPTYWVTDRWRHWFYRRLVMPNLDGVVGVSQTTLQSVQEMYGLQVPNVFIPNGFDTAPLQPYQCQASARQSLGIDPEAQVVLFMGNLTRQKRPDRFLRVMQQVKAQAGPVEVWLLGDGPLRADLKKQAQALGLGSSVRFWGYQTTIGPYLAAADMLLVTSDSDGIPAVVLEAGYLGKPTVATNVGGLPECVLPNKTGILVEPDNEAGLAEAVLELLHIPERRQFLGTEARRWMERNFTISRVAEQYVSFYEQLLNLKSKELSKNVYRTFPS